MSTLAESVEQQLNEVARRVGRLASGPALDIFGRVESIGDDVATVSGLPATRLNELLLFERNDGGQPVTGMVLALDPGLIGCAMLGRADAIAAGSFVRGTGSVASVPVGEMLLGRVVNPLGVPLDGGAELTLKGFQPVERPAPGIIERDLVNQALETGLVRDRCDARAGAGSARADYRRPRNRQDRNRRRYDRQPARLGRHLRLLRGRAEDLFRHPGNRSGQTLRCARAVHLRHRRSRRSSGTPMAGARTRPVRWRSTSANAAAMRCSWSTI